MKKKLLAVLLAGAVTAGVAAPITVYADGQKVVTLGYDLTDDQKTAILKYFGVLGENVETMYITNADEREHLGAYVPIEQIGSHTYSCALVKPTTSGGIQVKTANLTWVTSNMIASTLSTSGVVNCEVLAAAPFEVSGTGALTGILMAYETASGQTLDSEKKEIATQELIATGQIADTIGQDQATNIVNEIKIQVVEGQVTNQTEVNQIVNNVIENNISVESELSAEDKALLENLANQIAAQQYSYEDMQETLERVEANVSDLSDTVSQSAAADQSAQTNVSTDAGNDVISNSSSSDVNVTVNVTNQVTSDTEEKLPEDSILLNTDDSALGDSVIIDATNAEAVSAETETSSQETQEQEADFVVTTNDQTTVSADDTAEPAPEESAEPAPEAEASYSEDTTDEIQIPEATDEYTEYVDQTADENASYAEENTAEEDLYADENTAEADLAADENAVEDSQDENAGDVPAASLELGESRMVSAQADNSSLAAGTSVIALYVNSTGITPVSGALVVTDDFAAETARVDLSVSANIASAACPDSFLAENGWNEGSLFLINLGTNLSQYMTYTLTLENAVFGSVEDPSMQAVLERSDVLSGSNSYGISVYASDMNAYTVGNTLSAGIFTDGSAASAVVVDYSSDLFGLDAAEFDLINGDASFNISLYQSGKGYITTEFYDTDGNLIDTVTVNLWVLE